MLRQFVLLCILLSAASLCVCQDTASPPAPAPTPIAELHRPDCDEACQQGRANLKLQGRLTILTGLLVFVGLLQVGSMVWQGIVMNRTKSDVHAQAGLMKTQAEHMGKQVDLMQEQLTEMQLERKQSQKFTAEELYHLGEQASAAASAANAARNSADAALEQIAIVKAKERARIVVVRGGPEAIGSIDFKQADYSVAIRIENLGFTHALNVRARGGGRISNEITKGMAVVDLRMATLVRHHAEHPQQLDIPLTVEVQPLELSNPNLVAQVAGVIDYEDVFGDAHQTPFQYVMHFDKLRPERMQSRLSVTSLRGWYQYGSGAENHST
jgi:hypothetical protein